MGMAFSLINRKMLFDQVPEKIFEIEQAVQKLWTNFKLQVSITQ